jgi:SAM-dependent methyltransferase
MNHLHALLSSILLPTLENYHYSEAQRFSRELDLKLGFQIDEIEKKILQHEPHTPWAGLDPQALQTPYPEIRMILSRLDLQMNQTIIDLGAAYGRMGLVLAEFYPEVKFIGYEVSKERATEGNRFYSEFQHIQLLQADISRTDFIIPVADVYFIYDFGDLESIIRVMDQLKKISIHGCIRVVGRGRRIRDQIERHEPWLSQVHAPNHYGNFSIYRS